MEISFCSDCGAYIMPNAGRAVFRDGGPVILCDECSSRAANNEAQAFEQKYHLNPEKNISEANADNTKT